MHRPNPESCFKRIIILKYILGCFLPLIYLSLSSVASAEINCPAFSERSNFDSLRGGELIQLRHSLEDKNQADKAAVLQWSRQAGDENSTVTELGLGVVVCESSGRIGNSGYRMSSEFVPKIEYHKNTLDDKLKDTSSIGLAWTGTINKPELGLGSPDTPLAQPIDHVIGVTMNYKNDRVKTGEGIQTSISYHATKFLGANVIHGKDGALPFYYSPVIAIQAESGNGVESESGDVARIKPSLNVVLYPMGSTLNRNLSIELSYAGWDNFSRSGPYQSYDSYQEQKVIAINWNLLPAPADKDGEVKYSNIAIGIEYKKGEQPEQGQLEQEITQLSLKLRF